MKKLLDFVQSDNIAEELGKDRLGQIADRVIRQFDEDNGSMQDWAELVGKGLELAKPDINPRSTPWQGAANYKHTGIVQAVVSFGDRASAELLKPEELFMTEIIGKDADGQKELIAERIRCYENYNINHKMDGYRDEQSKLMYSLALYGTCFKKVYYDPMSRQKVSNVIHYPNFAVAQGTSCLEKARSFTEIHSYSVNQAKEFMAMGFWSDITIDASEDNQQGSNAAEQVTENASNPSCYYEQHTYLDLDDDGYEEPYIVTVHVKTSQVVRIVAAYTSNEIIVKNGKKVFSLSEAEQAGPSVLQEVLRNGQLVKVNRLMNVVKYGFIRSIDGTFLDIGYAWLLSALTNLVNTTANQLIDAGTISNRKGGFLAKEFRKGNMAGAVGFKPGEWKQTDIPAAALAQGIMPVPIGEPSQTLLTMNQDAKGELAGFIQSLDLNGIISGQVAPTTALVAVSEQLVPLNAIMQYIQRSMTKEFEQLMLLTPLYCDADEYKEVVGEEGDMEADYSPINMKLIKPTGQKNISSDVIRNIEAQAGAALVPMILQAGGNPIPIIRANIKLLKSIDADKVMPEMSPEQEAQQVEVMKIEQAKNAQLLDLQIQEKMGAVEAYKAEQMAFNMKQQGDMAKLAAEMDKIKSEIYLNLQKAKAEEAQAIKYAAEAQAQNIENQAIEDGIEELLSEIEGMPDMEAPEVEQPEAEDMMEPNEPAEDSKADEMEDMQEGDENGETD